MGKKEAKTVRYLNQIRGESRRADFCFLLQSSRLCFNIYDMLTGSAPFWTLYSQMFSPTELHFCVLVCRERCSTISFFYLKFMTSM